MILIQQSSVKYVLYLVMEQISAETGTTLLLCLQGIKLDEHLMAILGLVKGILEEVLEMLVVDFLMELMVEVFILILAICLVNLILEILICQEVLVIKVI